MFRHLTALSVLVLPLCAQQANTKAADDSAQLFYRAFFLERGERRFDEAVELYTQFVAAAPDHRYAGRARKSAVQLTLKQVDPLIRQLTQYRDFIDQLATGELPDVPHKGEER